MKNMFLIIFSAVLLTLTFNIAAAKTATTSPATAEAIKYYKSGNYTQAYLHLKELVEKDPSNSLAHYYLAMTFVQLGKKNDAIQNYEMVLQLSPSSVLSSYAKRGIKCLDNPVGCHEPEVPVDNDTDEDKFIKGNFGSGFSTKARGVYEREKIESMKREINRDADIEFKKFKEYKDFSSQAPTNEEIVSALRTLQQAGFGNIFTNNGYSDVSAMLGTQNNLNNSSYDMINLLTTGNNSGRNYNLNPQIIQALMTSQMTTNF